MESKGTESKNCILKTAGAFFVKNGYHATGIQQILEQCKLPKGSFYYHFKGKEELAIQVCEYYQGIIYSLANEATSEKTWEGFVQNFITKIIEKMEDDTLHGCPIAVLGMETAKTEPKIAMACQNALMQLENGFETIRTKYGYCGEKNKAPLITEIYEGALVMYRVSNDISILMRLKQQLCTL